MDLNSFVALCVSCGKGMKGSGFWDDFYDGFKSVVKPGFQVLGGVVDALGAPELGIPLQVISGLM